MRHVFVLVLLAACGGAAKPAPRPAPVQPATQDEPPAEPAPVRVRIPDGWLDVLHTTEADFDAAAGVAGTYAQLHAMAERNGYLAFALELHEDSPDHGAMMTMLPMGVVAPVDQALLDRFIADNNLGLTAALTVEATLLSVDGRAIAKWRTEYAGEQGAVTTLVYLFAADDGQLVELVYVVPAARFDALRAQLESIQG